MSKALSFTDEHSFFLFIINTMGSAAADAKICKIINNSAGECLISLKFCTDFDHLILDVPRTFKVSGSKLKVTV